MNKLGLLLSLLTASLLSAGARVEAAELLIENVSLLSPERDSPLPAQHVLLREGRIARISASAIAVGPEVHKLDGSGKFLTPGLMDAHVHLSEVPGLRADMPGYAELRAAYVRQQPRSYLYHGFTQVLDLAGSPDKIAEFEHQPLHPALFRCGAAAALGGYSFREMSADLPPGAGPLPFIAEPGVGPEATAGTGLPNWKPAQHTPEAVVKRIANSGADCLKVFAENGFGEASHLPVLSEATFKRVKAAAHQAGLPLFVHANAYDMLQQALAIPADVLVHGVWNWTGIPAAEVAVAREQKQLPPSLTAALQRIREKGIAYQPTLQVMNRMAALFEPGTLEDPLLQTSVPSVLRAHYRRAEAQWFKRELAKDFPPNMPDAAIARILRGVGQTGAYAMKALHDMGHPLSLGSDTPSSPTYAHQPGVSSFLEMRDMAAAGIPLHAIFQAATIHNARLVQRANDYGSIEVGKKANLLLLAKNPLESVEHWLTIEQVILEGVAHARESFAAQ